MLKKICFDFKLIHCMTKTIICLDAIKKFLCVTLIIFALLKGVFVCKKVFW
ncbi:MAG: hypothetical protein IKK85_07210 [Clostridia bacterium]|nr:hypothetical protein [Clostridia bacterium]